jgi:Ca2+/Na+ antiporter
LPSKSFSTAVLVREKNLAAAVLVQRAKNSARAATALGGIVFCVCAAAGCCCCLMRMCVDDDVGLRAIYLLDGARSENNDMIWSGTLFPGVIFAYKVCVHRLVYVFRI